MLHQLSLHVARICAAEDRAQINAALAESSEDLGFISHNLTFGKLRPQEFMTDPDLTSWSTHDLEVYERDGWGPRDPLMRQLERRGPAHLWHSADWLGTPDHGYAEYLAGIGIGSGVTIPLASPTGHFNALTMLSLRSTLTEDQLAAARIIAHVAQSRLALVGLRHAGSQSSAAKFRSLSDRQREILHWAAMGKSNAEIAIIMGQSTRGIDYHIREITRKLGVASRIQAIVIYAREQR